MTRLFYSSQTYKALQCRLTKKNWELGKFKHLEKRAVRACERKGCGQKFSVISSDPKKFCSPHCAVLINNTGRRLSINSRAKIARALTGRPGVNRGKKIIPRVQGICLNDQCKKPFLYERWQKRKFCSVQCSMFTIGSRPTSPRAARAKAGIRLDIDPTIYFFSRWEANYARILNFQSIKWVHQPKTFQLKSQKYTPDFYLPAKNMFVEIKNFLSDYSVRRDREFRELYPNLKLKLILKKEYLGSQKRFAPKIKTWEYS